MSLWTRAFAGGGGTLIAALQGMHPWIRRGAAVIASAGLVTTTGCAAEWPRRATALSASAAADRQLEIATVDVLPIDLQAWSDREEDGELADVRATGEGDIRQAVLDTLAARRYQIGALLDWDGTFRGTSAMPREELLATIGSLAHYGEATEDSPGRLPVPYLPAKLGATTGADATLYVGGWAYVGSPDPGTAEQVGKGILIGLAIVTVVAIVFLVADRNSHDHRGRHHRSSRFRGGLASHAAQVSATAGATTITSARDDHGIRHAELHAGALPSAPDWIDDDALPHEGSQSQMYLEATLIDNRTGFAVWHAHQTFPARMTNRDDTVRAMRTLLAQLPARAAAATALASRP